MRRDRIRIRGWQDTRVSRPRALLMPKLGLTMTEGSISQWCVTEGARFHKSDVLLVIETDKVAHDVEAPGDGELKQILVPAGDTVPVATEIGLWVPDGADADDVPGPPPAHEHTPLEATPPVAPVAPVAPAAPAAPDGFIRATPLARRLARERAIPLAALAGTGPNGSIVAADVGAPAAAAADSRGVKILATAYHRTMAERLAVAKRDTPHFYLAVDVDVGGLLDWRSAWAARGEAPRLTLTHLLLAAAARALRSTPDFNCVWRDGDLLRFRSVDIGLAVDTPRGLANPVVADLGGDGLADVVRKADASVARARAGLLRPADLEGGALSISNAGMHEVRYMASIVPPGQSAILGVGAVQRCFRPDAHGAAQLRRELGIVLSADHRVHTGVSALAFLNALRAAMGAPDALLQPQ